MFVQDHENKFNIHNSKTAECCVKKLCHVLILNDGYVVLLLSIIPNDLR
jgi:hypothetical protein